MEGTKKYEVVNDTTIKDEEKVAGDVVELTDEEAVEYGDNIKLAEEVAESEE